MSVKVGAEDRTGFWGRGRLSWVLEGEISSQVGGEESPVL